MPDYSKDFPFEWRERHASIYEDGSSATEAHEVRKVGSLGVQAIRFCRGSNSNFDPACPELVLGLTLAGSAAVRWSWGDRWRENAERTRGQFGLSPIGEPGYFEVDGPHEVLAICIPLAGLGSMFADDDSGIRTDYKALHEAYRYDRMVFQVSTHLWDLAGEPSPASTFEADAALRFLLARLSRLADERGPEPEVELLKFSPSECRVVVDYVESHLSQSISVSQLAKQVGMPVRRFHSSFVASFGTSPSRYLRAVRLARARELIKSGRSLSEVVNDCGFADQSHLTRLYRSRFGVTPGADRGNSTDAQVLPG